MSNLPSPFAPLSLETASRFAHQALDCITREFPNAPGYILNDPSDLQTPRALHPAFYGCLDWHSSVHSHWMLVRLLRRFPQLPEAKAVRAALHTNLTAANLATEAAYFDQPYHGAFERLYGWAWVLQLAQELHDWDDADGRGWSRNLSPLTATLVACYQQYLPKLTYPIRVGTHANTAFGIALALDYARACGQPTLEALLVERSLTYFAADVNAPAAWEPNGGDFFSPSLIEADLLCRVLPPAEFARWFERFLPTLAHGEPARLLHPVTITDRRDPQMGHLDGLHLTRAWCMHRIASHLPNDAAVRPVLLASAERHAQAGLAHVITDEYMGAHWLASFAVYLLT